MLAVHTLLGHRLPVTCLSACIAATFTLASPLAAATVTSCDDTPPNAVTTPGTLRYEIANAADGATIDFNLPAECNSTITLKTGVIPIAQNSLTLQSSGPKIGIEKYIGVTTPAGVLNHQGTGTLTLNNLSFYGKYNGPNARGGCVRSSGNVRTQNTDFNGCQAIIENGGYPIAGKTAYGGAVYTAGFLYMVSSTITNSSAQGPGPNFAQCGAADARGGLTMINSTISGSEAFGYVAIGGAACAGKGALIVGSTISGNKSMTNTKGFFPPFPALVSGLMVHSDPGSAGNYLLLIVNSTISGNYSYSQAGAIYSNIPTAIFNSTVARNTVKNVFYSLDPGEAAGLALAGPNAVALVSSLFTGNTVSGNERDVSLRLYGDPSKDPTVTGQNNLIVASNQASALPGDTIFGTCARLGPLRDNGGPTLTHALFSGSAAIDAGANPGVGFGPLGWDQRGPPYARESTTGLPDIGAYEVQKDEILFNTGFEDCP